MRNTLLVAGLMSVLVGGCDEKKAPPMQAAAPSSPKTSQVAPPVPTGVPAATGAVPSRPAAANPAGISVLGMNFALPAGWKSVTPGHAMRLAEVQVPDPSGDAAKMCTVVFSTAGGDVDSNIARWGTQVTDASGQPTKPQPTVREVAGMKVHTVELTGAFANMGEPAPHQNWMLRGAVVEMPAGLLFVKMTGPVEPMKAAAPGFTAMVDGMKK